METVTNELLRRVPLFSSLTKRDILFLGQISRLVDLPAKSVLFKEGDVGDRLYVIVRGELEIIKAFGTSEETILRVCSAGEHIGEMSFLSPGGVRSATVKAKTETRLIEISRDDFESFLSQRPELAGSMARCLAQRLADAENRFLIALADQARESTGYPSADRASLEREYGPWALKIYTLGRFEIEIGGVALRFSGKAPRVPLQMLKLLVSSGESALSEEVIADCLWPDADGDAAHNAFSTTLSRLRRLLGVEGAIVFQERKASIDPRCCWVDAHVFRRILIELEKGEGEEKTACLERGTWPSEPMAKALALYQGHFLPADEREPWVISCRERMRAAFSALIIKVADPLEKTGQWEKAVDYYQRGLDIDDTSEEFYQRLMICLRQLGLDANAVDLYRRCKKLLAAKLGIEPSAKTEAIYKSIGGVKDNPF